MTEPKVIRWGILGPGRIAQTFTRNLLSPTSSPLRTEQTLTHQITAVASNTSLTTASTFIETHIQPHQPPSKTQCHPFGTYLSLITSDLVDVVYVATPHTHHFHPAMLALQHGIPVLVEKPICVNALQAGELVRVAREQRVFLMEAVWTRFFPLCLWVQSLIACGRVGEVVRCSADFSLGVGDSQGWEDEVGGGDGRVLNPRLAGGGLLDLGVYSLTWVFLAVYHTLDAELRQPPRLVGATMTPYHGKSGQDGALSDAWVDTNATLLLTMPSFPSGSTICHAVATTSLHTTTDPGYGGDDHSNTSSHRWSTPSVRVQGTKGEIQIFGPLPRPQKVRVFNKFEPVAARNQSENVIIPGNVVGMPGNSGYHVEERIFDSKGDGNGMYWEADEVGRCLKDGKVESEIMPLDETLAVIKVVDQAREMCGLHYGDEIEGI